ARRRPLPPCRPPAAVAPRQGPALVHVRPAPTPGCRADVAGPVPGQLVTRPAPDRPDRPDWIQVEVGGRVVALSSLGKVLRPAALLWAVNLDAVELHPLLARVEALERPTAVVFDLDPGWASSLVACCRLALRIRTLLGDLGLSCQAKTSGWNGLHVFAPVAEATYRVTKALARAVARVLASEIPEHAVDLPALDLRAGRVFVDWSQNDFSKSTVA